MPATAVSYTPRPYVRSQEPYGLPYAPRGNTLAELLRLRGTDAARFASRGGDISAQMWQNLAGQISDAGQSLSQYYAERPQREAQARATEQEEEYRRLKNEEAQVTLDANERELEIGTGLELLFSPSQWRSRGDKPPTTQQLIDVAGPERGMAIANAWQALQTPEDTPEDVRKVALGLQAAPEELRRLLWPSLRARFTRSLQLNPADVPEAYDADFLALAANYGQEEQTPPTRAVQTVDASGNPVTRIVRDVPGTSYPSPPQSQFVIPTYDAGADEPLDPKSQDLMSHAGLSYNGFLAITGRMSQLPRDRETRNRASAEVSSWARERGMDVSTFASQYRAYNEALENNIQRYNRTLLAEGEIEASVANLKGAAARSGFGDTRAINAARQWAQGELNDPTAAEYAFFLNQLTNDIALYNAASQGRGALQSDLEEAKSVVRRGIATGSLTGMQSAITQSVKKMGTVLEGAVNRSRRNVWELFGVGDRYRSTTEDATVVPPEESRISTVEMRTPDGRTIFVPLDKVEEALSRQAVIVGGR